MMKEVNFLNPIEQIARVFEAKDVKGRVSCPHITFDESVDDDYQLRVIRDSSHDGTLLFTEMLIAKTLEPLVKMSFADKRDMHFMDQVSKIDYTVGNLKLESEYKNVDVPAGNIPGVVQTVTIPVRLKYTYRKGESE